MQRKAVAGPVLAGPVLGSDMKCTVDLAFLDLMALQAGALHVEGRFRLAQHISHCNQCKVELLLMLEVVDESGSQVTREIRAVAVLADVYPPKVSTWLLAMFQEIEVPHG